jgi:hypothetical protein
MIQIGLRWIYCELMILAGNSSLEKLGFDLVGLCGTGRCIVHYIGGNWMYHIVGITENILTPL